MRKLDILVLVALLIATWRLVMFRWGLIAAVMATIAFFPSCVHQLRTLEPAHGVWLIANWVGIVLWMIGLSGASTGKGWGRVTLICWGILMFVGMLGISEIMIP